MVDRPVFSLPPNDSLGNETEERTQRGTQKKQGSEHMANLSLHPGCD